MKKVSADRALKNLESLVLPNIVFDNSTPLVHHLKAFENICIEGYYAQLNGSDLRGALVVAAQSELQFVGCFSKIPPILL
jgi:hypothetical protein